MIKWEFDIKKQIDRYHKCAQSISRNYFQEKRFYVLQYLPEKSRNRTVLFPFIKSYTEDFNRNLRLKSSEELPDNVKKDILEKANEIYKYHKKNFDKLEHDWKRISSEFIKLVEKQFPSSKNIDIIINPSIFESIGGYWMDKHVYIFPRFDRNISQVCHLVINALTHYFQYDAKELSFEEWKEKQAKVKENILRGGYHQILKPYKGMTNVLSKHSVGSLATESAENYKKLGCPIVSALTDVSQIRRISNQESEVLDLLMANRNKVISYEEIAKAIWKEDWVEKFSLYGISKVIERLKRKVEKSGLSDGLINTERGKGYLLYD